MGVFAKKLELNILMIDWDIAIFSLKNIFFKILRKFYFALENSINRPVLRISLKEILNDEPLQLFFVNRGI